VTLFDAVDVYCERTGPEIWAEPFNALSNLGFFLAAALLLRRMDRETPGDLRALAWLVALVGGGSLVFHTIAQVWAGALDILFIALFVLAALQRVLVRAFGLRNLPAGAIVVAIAAASAGIAGVLHVPALNGSELYLGAWLALIALALGCPRPDAARWLRRAALMFAVSVSLRSMDLALCPAFPAGTHFAWHLVNAVVLWCCVRALLPAPTERGTIRRTGDPSDMEFGLAPRSPKPAAARSLRFAALVLLVFFAPLAGSLTAHLSNAAQASDWRTARRDSAGIAPDPASTPEALIQVYAARAFRWRGAFAVHTWIAAKPAGADHFTRFEVFGWGVSRGLSAVRVAPGIPDGYWYGARPELIRELRGGADIDRLIERLHAAAASYPYQRQYTLWPGPNSNTFIAYLGRAVPELSLELPPTAIGKDYLPGGGILARTPSGSGVQLSLAGLLGVTLGLEEGVEINLLGLTAGIDLWPPALKLPGIGRLGFAERAAP
jgi:hypothetical protein